MATSQNPFPEPTQGVRLNIGCQSDYRGGWINVDRNPPADKLCDLEQPWPLEDASADYILASHIIEHVADFGHFMREAFRVLKPGGVFDVITPHGGDPEFWRDPTHIRGYTASTFRIYCTLPQDSPWHIAGLPTFAKCTVKETFATVNDDRMRIVNARLVKGTLPT